MNPQRDVLSDALREMSDASPQASPELGASLGEAFARHHARRRRRNRTAIVIGLAACLAISVALLRANKQTNTARVARPISEVAKTPSPEQKVVVPESWKPEPPTITKAVAKPRLNATKINKPRNQGVEAQPASEQTGDFVALSTFDPAVPLGESRMVRMDLPGSALQQIGYPVDGQLLDRRILTDVLVGQDGMPYAVRLVQTRNVH